MASVVLERRAYKHALRLQMRKDYSATIIGAGKSYYKRIDRSGPISPHNIFHKLKSKLSTIGELYTRHNGNFVGCCAEVNAANQILNKLPHLKLNQINFSNAIGPRTMQKIPTCQNCKLTFN